MILKINKIWIFPKTVKCNDDSAKYKVKIKQKKIIIAHFIWMMDKKQSAAAQK